MPASLKVTRVDKSRLTEEVRERSAFGSAFADHMLVARYADGRWGEPEIVPYGPMPLSPALSSLHYGQSLFEGFKAYRTPRGPAIFRMRDNHLRLNRSAARLCMPPVPEDVFADGIAGLVQIDRE